MTSLGSEARALISAGRDALRPTAADQSRIAASLHARLAEAAAGTGAAAAATTAAHSNVLLWSGVSAVVVGLGAGGLWLAGAFGTAESAAPGPAPAAPAAPAATLAAPVEPPAPVPAPAAGEPSAPEASNAASEVEQPAAVGAAQPQARKRAQDGLREEVELLSRAQTDLRAGRHTAALRTLDEHARKFPRGALAQERRATRIQALCGAGRVNEGETELARLARGSVHERRAREACEAARKGP